MDFARRVFFWAGVYGIAALLPGYFLEQRIGLDMPPALTHAEYYYGFIGGAAIDLLLFVLFFIAYKKTASVS